MEPLRLLDGNVIFRGIYCFLAGEKGGAVSCTRDGLFPVGWEWLAYFIAGFAIVFLLVNALLIFASVFVWMLRRVLGRFQTRLGPNRVGPFGLLQPIADLVKLLVKEDLRPTLADPITFNLAPVLAVAPVLILVAVIPFGHGSYLVNLNIGVLFLIGVTTVSTLAVFLAGWGSGNRFALFGAVRAVAVLVSYEVPMVLALAGVLLLAGSMSLVSVVEAQRLPFILLQPLGFFVFFLAASAEMNWTPFDLLEAESELTAGFHTEYSGMKFGLLQLAEFATVVTTSAVITTLYLRGWQNPFVSLGGPQVLPSQIWFLIKVLALIVCFIWIKATIPRFRVDQVMGFAWKVLFPLALINIVLTAGLAVLWPQPSTGQLWAMVGINLGATAACVLAFGSLLERHRRRPGASVTLRRITAEVH
jgi:NADH-quinone oxidoreductase subunit H